MERPEASITGDPEAIQVRRWVREWNPHDDPALGRTATGTLLPDGAVVLRESDIDRMGIRLLRRWLAANVLRPGHPIVLVRRRPTRPGPSADEEEVAESPPDGASGSTAEGR
ncbi:MAG: hypothetical protein ACHQ52_07380 [Candidatus Eisenbacteria bacterium]